MGPDKFKSNLITKISTTPEGKFKIRGRGWGHGAGMCQYGMKYFGELGYGYRKFSVIIILEPRLSDCPIRPWQCLRKVNGLWLDRFKERLTCFLKSSIVTFRDRTLKRGATVKHQGLSLVEVVVSLVLLSVLALGVSSVFSLVSSPDRRSETGSRDLQAANYARQTLEELKNAVSSDEMGAGAALLDGTNPGCKDGLDFVTEGSPCSEEEKPILRGPILPIRQVP